MFSKLYIFIFYISSLADNKETKFTSQVNTTKSGIYFTTPRSVIERPMQTKTDSRGNKGNV